MASINSVFLLLGAVIVAGFLLRKSGAVGENDYKIYFKLITTLVIPCLILSNFRSVELTPEYLSIFAVSCLFGLMLSALVYVLLPGKTRTQKGMAALNFAGINVVFIGIPLAEALLGPQATPIMVASHGGNAVTLYAFCVIHAQLYTEQGADWKAAGRRLVTSPVLLALAAESGRDLLVFDEPTSGLDGYNMRLTVKLLRQLAAAGKCLLLITHDMDLIAAAADCVLYLEQGKLRYHRNVLRDK